MPIAAPIEYLKSIVTNYTASLFIISGIGLWLFYRASDFQKEFPKEALIAKIGAMAYMVIGLGLFLARFFFKM